MNSYFAMLRRASLEKKKEEQDSQEELTLKFEMTPLHTRENLDKYFTGLRIGTKLIESYDSYQQNLDILLSQTKETELNYRYRKQCEKDNILCNQSTVIDQMQAVGKIGDDTTFIDPTSLFGQLEFGYNRNKIKSKNSFASVRANNCVSKGKWCYEVQILTNGLQQIGWCQLNTPFTNGEGVGDDDSSWAYDGYRIVKWHKGSQIYGQIWDIGDIVGCCIDLSLGTMDYYINGVHLGVAFRNIPIGENRAYFPGISLSEGERCTFNFGKSPFHYAYPGYEPLDLPESQFNGNLEITAQILDILKSNTMDILLDNAVPYYHKLLISSKIFSFLVHVSFSDQFIFQTLLLPFLFDLSTQKPEAFIAFFENILPCFENSHDRNEFFTQFFDNLCSLIEEYALTGVNGIKTWTSILMIFKNALKIDSLANIWIEIGKYIEQLKMILTSNSVRMNDLYEFTQSKLDILNTNESVTYAFHEVKKEYYQKNKAEIDSWEGIYSDNLTELIKQMLSDERKFKIYGTNGEIKEITLNAIFQDLIKRGYDLGNNNVNDFLQLIGSPMLKKNDSENFYKNVYYSLVSILCDNFINLPLESFSCRSWFTRSSPDNIFYDEVGIGGTISHVTTEYISQIDETFQSMPTNLHSEFINNLIKLSSNCFVQYIRDFQKQMIKYKSAYLRQIIPHEHGTNDFDRLFRRYFYLFSEPKQVMLYKFGYFLINWMEALRKENYMIIYFIPKSLAGLPFEIFRFLSKLKSNILNDDDLRKSVNACSIHFSQDNFIYQILQFYTALFRDSAIANPELREGIIYKIKFFMKKKKTAKLYEGNDGLVGSLIIGLLNYMSIESLSHIACEIICKIIKPICFGHKNTDQDKNPLVEITKNFFETNLTKFHEFMDNYSKLINKIMTDYVVALSEASETILKGNPGGNQALSEAKSNLLRRICFLYSILCDLMKIFEFLLAAYPNEFLDVETLNFSRFCNFLKNLDSRILEKPYIENLILLLERAKGLGEAENILTMAYSVIGIFLRLNESKSNPKFTDFSLKVANLSDFYMAPFLNLFNVVTTMTIDDSIRDSVEQYKDIVTFFDSLRSQNKSRKVLNTEEWEETTKNENLCILCYNNLSDRMMKPCKHVACNECLMQYMSDKSHCFICNTTIETVEKIDITSNNK